MRMLLGFVLGVIVATAGLSWAQYWQQPGQPLDLSVGTRDWQSFEQDRRIRDLEFRSIQEPCGR